MAEVVFDPRGEALTVHTDFYLYGEAASPSIARHISEEINDLWNEPRASTAFNGRNINIRFRVEAIYQPDLAPETVWYNDNPRLAFFRIEEYSGYDISFVDGLSCNTGYFKLGNLTEGSTTAAHEYGHMLGLEHPRILDIRGKGVPGIMYPRGTLCDPAYQYIAEAEAGTKGGTLNPVHRRVTNQDIAALSLDRLRFQGGKALLGGFSSIFHQQHQRDDGFV
jgi:hypothetical protein